MYDKEFERQDAPRVPPRTYFDFCRVRFPFDREEFANLLIPEYEGE
jgi:hypothetical protein